MTNLHAQHSKGWSGLAFVALLVVAILIGGMPPEQTAGPGAIASYLTDHREGLVVSGWLTFPLGAFFLWFVVGLSAYLKQTATEDEGLPTYVLVAGTFVAVAAWVGSGLMTAMVYQPSSGATSFIWTMQMFLQGPFLSMPITVMIFAAAHSMRRHSSAPAWLIWLGYLTALLEGISTLGVFSASSMAAGSMLLGFAGLILFLIYIAAAGLYLVTAGGGKERAGVTSRA